MIRIPLIAALVLCASLSSAAPAVDESKPATQPMSLSVGQRIEVKTARHWDPAVVVKKQGAWTLVKYDREDRREWVEPFRIRKLGSTEDNIGRVDWNPSVHGDEGPPSAEPGNYGEPRKTDAGTAGSNAANGKPREDPFTIPEDQGVAGLPITPVDRTGVKTIALTAIGAATARPAVDNTPFAKMTARSVPLHKVNFGLHPRITFNPLGKFVAVFYVPWGNDAAIGFERADFSAGSSGSGLILAPKIDVLAISPDGAKMLTRSDKFFPATRWRADLWALTSTTAKAVMSFRPYADAGGRSTIADCGIAWAQFLDNDRLITCSVRNQVTLWQVSEKQPPKAVYTIDGDSSFSAAGAVLSDGCKYVIIPALDSLFLCDTASGEPVARVPAAANVIPRLGAIALRHEGDRIAISGDGRIVVCRVDNGQIVHDVGLPLGVWGRDVGWVGDDQLVLDNTWLVDLRHHSFVWRYEESPGADAYRTLIGDRLWYVSNPASDAKQPLLTSTTIPDPFAKTAMKKLADAEPLVQVGSKVSLEVSLSASEQEHKQIVEHLTHQLEAMGATVTDGQPVKLVATTAQGGSQDLVYRGMGMFGGGGTHVTVTQIKYLIAFQLDGKPVWEISSMSPSAPMMVWTKKGESIEQKVAEETKATFGWYLTTTLPKVILKPREPLALGTSTLSAAGAKPTNHP